ncbi:MAG: PilZ domain-containing protein [Thermoanaerobaculia bacterium]
MLRDDRREFQRLKLSKPILAQIGTGPDAANALILDIGVSGAFLEHYGTAAHGDQFPMTFRWQGADVTFQCEVVRSNVVRLPGGDGKSTTSHTGVRFVEAVGDARARLQDLITTFVGRILDAQRANAAGETAEASAGATVLARLGEARRTRSRGFVTYHFEDNAWWRVPGNSAIQPPNGFTVGDFEDQDELEQLCRTYEEADESGRHLIRLVAELSLVPDR